MQLDELWKKEQITSQISRRKNNENQNSKENNRLEKQRRSMKWEVDFWEEKQKWQTFFQANQERKIQINKVRYEKGGITTDTAGIQRIIKAYYE